MENRIPHKLDSEVSKHPRICAATRVCETLHAAGRSSYWVGGAVRDILLSPQNTPNDIDIATDASFQEICDLFPHTKAIGKAFSVGLVTMGDYSFEVASFRKESDYRDRRHPSLIGPGSIEDDSERRDFTINALYFDPVDAVIRDFHDGVHDLQRRILRCVGDPALRLHEDPLRILRLYRFASNLDFTIHPQTQDAAITLSTELVHISRERILLEISKLKPQALTHFQAFLSAIQSHLIGKSTATSAMYAAPQKPLSVEQPTIQSYPGTVFALMCSSNEGLASRHWSQCFKDWPLSQEEKAHLEFYQRVNEDRFVLPRSTEDVEWKNFLESVRWLQRQARVNVASALLLLNWPTVVAKRNNEFLVALARVLTRASQRDSGVSQAPLSVFLESFIRSKAQPVREKIDLILASAPSSKSVGWARVMVDTHHLLSELQCTTQSTPGFLENHTEETLALVCATAEKWSTATLSPRHKK